MTVAAESLNRAVGATEAKRVEEFRSRFFPQDVSYAFVTSRLEPKELDKLQKNDEIITEAFNQAMSAKGILNFRVERDVDDLAKYGFLNLSYILRFQEGPKSGLWTEALGFKAVVINCNLYLKEFSANIPLVAQNDTNCSKIQLQEALKLARNSSSGKLINAEVYFEIYHSTNVPGNLRGLLNLALVRPTRVPPKF